MDAQRIHTLSRRSLLRTGALAALGAGAAGALSGCGAVQLATGQADGVPARDPADRTLRIIVTESEPYQEPTEIARGLLAQQIGRAHV